MNAQEKKVWEFACNNADFWPLLRSADAPAPEVAALTGEEREAFDAARDVVQNKYADLLRCCWDELMSRWDASRQEPCFNARRIRATLLSAVLSNSLPRNKGYLSIWVDPVENNHLGLKATVWVANKRLAQARAVFEGFVQDGNFLYKGIAIIPELSNEDLASQLHDAYFGKLLEWVVVPDDGSSSAGDE